jgi:hypothetical protein
MNVGRFLFMLDDASVKGRQTNRKFIVLLLLLALTAWMSAWGLSNLDSVSSGIQKFKNRIFGGTPQWQAAACTPETKAVRLGNGVCMITDGTISVMDDQGQVQYSLDTDAKTLGGGAIAYTPLGKTLWLLETDHAETLNLSGGVDVAVTGTEGCIAVITAGSGYLTMTEIYDASGQLLGQIGLTDAAMAAAAFLSKDQLLAGLCVLKDGSWELRYYGIDGRIKRSIALEDLTYRGIYACGNGVLVENEEKVQFFNEAGDQSGCYAWDSESLAALACSQEGYAVLALSRGSTYELRTIGTDGSLWGNAQLDGPIRGLSVCGNTVCILDFDGLEVYDRHCEPTKIFPEGASAATVVAEEHSCWLLGDGEVLHLGFT